MFMPKRVIFEESALNYDLGKKILDEFKGKKDVQIMYSKSGRITSIPGKDDLQKYLEGKSTLVVGVRKKTKFQSCKPSANYQLPIVSGCMGMCEYCYLNTQMGKKPYIKIYVNLDEILDTAKEYIEERKPYITVFEGAATSDPVPVEDYSHGLKKCIEYFGKVNDAYFRFVTKYTDIDSLIGIDHNGKTTVRFSINTDDVIRKFEHKTPNLKERLKAAKKIADDGYKVGFIIAPVFMYENWKEEYYKVLKNIHKDFLSYDLEFEVISHRFTKRAKENILNVFKKTTLPMEEELRKFKFGQFGYGKYVYKDDEMKDFKNFFKENISKLFGDKSIKYII